VPRVKEVVDPVAELHKRRFGRGIEDPVEAVTEPGSLPLDRILLRERIDDHGDIRPIVIGKREGGNKLIGPRDPVRCAVLVYIMEPRGDDRHVRAVEHRDEGHHPGRVGDIRRTPVLAQLPLVGPGGVVSGSLDRKHPPRRILIKKPRAFLHTSSLHRFLMGFLVWTGVRCRLTNVYTGKLSHPIKENRNFACKAPNLKGNLANSSVRDYRGHPGDGTPSY